MSATPSSLLRSGPSLHSRPEGFVTGSSALTIRQRLGRLWTYRRILRLLVGRDLKVRYAGSALGYLWTVLDPLLQSLVYWFVFTKIFHRTAGPEYEPYLVYLVSGQLIWAWFNGGILGVTKALRSEAQMVRSTNVPRELWVLRVVMSKGVEYFFGLPVLVLFAVLYSVQPTKYTLMLPLAWLLVAILVMGFGLILAPLCVLVRDVERVVPIVMRVLFFASPVIYAIDRAPKSLQTVFSFNPTVGFLTLTHAVFFPAAIGQTSTRVVGGTPVLDQASAVISGGKAAVKGTAHIDGGTTVTEHVTHWNWIWHSSVVAVLIFVIGLVVFVRLERSMLKEI